MCCSPDHLGSPPEWRNELAAEGLAPPLPRPRVTAADLAAWGRLLGDRPRGPRPVSTEGGQGHAWPVARWLRHGEAGPGLPRERDTWQGQVSEVAPWPS